MIVETAPEYQARIAEEAKKLATIEKAKATKAANAKKQEEGK